MMMPWKPMPGFKSIIEKNQFAIPRIEITIKPSLFKRWLYIPVMHNRKIKRHYTRNWYSTIRRSPDCRTAIHNNGWVNCTRQFLSTNECRCIYNLSAHQLCWMHSRVPVWNPLQWNNCPATCIGYWNQNVSASRSHYCWIQYLTCISVYSSR